jgi:hypothetical protein
MNIETKNELDRNRSTVDIESEGEIHPAELEAVATGLPVRSKVKAGAELLKHACKSWTLV